MLSSQSNSKSVGTAVEHLAESTVACVFSMVQGNLAVIGLSHLVIAIQTGLLTGLFSLLGLLIVKTQRRFLLAVQLGIATVLADFLIHYFALGTSSVESLYTGMMAVFLYLLYTSVFSGQPDSSAV